MKFKNMEDVDNWACHTLPFANIQNHQFSIGDQNFIISCVSGCSGVYCFKIHCLVRFGCMWYLTATAFTHLTNSFKNYSVDNANRILFFNSDADTLGSLGFETAIGNYQKIIRGNNIVFFEVDGSNYMTDIDNRIFYKIDTINANQEFAQNDSNHIRCVDGNIFYNQQKLLVSNRYSNNICRGYFNANLSNNQNSIVCERRTVVKQWNKAILPPEIVEIDVQKRKIKNILPYEGCEPHYSPYDNQLILYHEETPDLQKRFSIVDKTSNELLLHVKADTVFWVKTKR